MSQFIDIFRHEFKMSLRRPGLWIAYSIVCLFFGIALFAPNHSGPTEIFTNTAPWQEAGETVYLFNMLMPLITGILTADRMQRDYRLNLRELQTSTPMRNSTYILGKYFGALLSSLLPMFLWVIGVGIYAVATGQTTLGIIGYIVVAFVAIVIPSFAFVTAFSLACPLIIPIRVYQILFTGYWFWGNFLNDEAFPTISHTVLNSCGIYALQGFFQGAISQTHNAPYTAPEACVNILVLCLCAVAVLFTLDRYLIWQARRA